jgi:hypothetical protein
MVPLRTRSKGAELVPFGLAALFFVLGSTPLGYSDADALPAQRTPVAESPRAHLTADPAAALRVGAFSFPRPLGSHIPESEGVRLASFDPDEIVTGTIPKGLGRRFDRSTVDPLVYPSVDRSSKGDRLIPAAKPDPAGDSAPDHRPLRDLTPKGPDTQPGPGVANDLDELQAAVRDAPLPDYDISFSLELNPQGPGDAPDGTETSAELPPPRAEEAAKFNTARLYFDSGQTGLHLAAIEPWAAGEEPILMVPRASGDPDLKRPVVATAPMDGRKAGKEGITIAGKGEVTGEGRRPKTPAEHLGLFGKSRAKAEKCLANAVYFESRSEPMRGQIGVAQVVLNRVFSGFYPEEVCAVVYQNANRYLSCQFTFACDGIPDVVTEPEEWERAKRIARESLDGKLWLRDVGKATHYHASYVYPYWARSMRKMTRIGLHTFYRPRAWGDGSDEISWGNTVATADAAAKL